MNYKKSAVIKQNHWQKNVFAKKAGALSLAALLVLSLAGCSGTGSDVKDGLADVAANGNAANGNTANGAANYTADSTNILGVSVSYLNAAEMFTERDKEIGYDDTTATTIRLADNAITCIGKNTSVTDNTVTITGSGTYLLSGSLSNGQIVVAADDLDKVQLVLNGVDINCDTSAAIYVKTADKVFLTLASGSLNTLANSAGFIAIDDNNIDSVIFSKSDLTLNGNGSLTVQAAYGHGIVSKDDLKITSGTYDITAVSSALSGKDSVRIADGVFSLYAAKDGIHSENDENESKGFIYIAGGSFSIACGSDGLDASSTLQIDDGSFSLNVGDDGFHADNDLIINDGSVIINDCYEGLEGQTVTINGGSISLNASDDGINAAGGKDQSGFGGRDKFASNDNCFIVINGGSLHITASGDGIDSNGNLAVTGGEIYVSGPASDGNSALDYDGNALITGGTLVATGFGGMAQNFGTDSTQGSMLVTFSSQASAGDVVTLQDASGREILSYTPEKTYRCTVISCPEIIQGETYTVTAGNQSCTVEMTHLIYGNGGDGFKGNHGFGGRGGFDGNVPDFGGNASDFDGRHGFGGGRDRLDGNYDFGNDESMGNGQMPEGNPPQFNKDGSSTFLDSGIKER